MSNASPSGNVPDLGQVVNGLAEGYKVFDRYTLMKVVGYGRLSVVWLAWDERLDRDIALKFLPAMTKPDPSALANLKREVRKLQDFKHAQIVPIDNVEQDGPLVAISMDYVEGASLVDLLGQKSNHVFGSAELQDWMQQLCSLLEYAHHEGPMAHGDLKPANILIDQKGTLRLTDFGLERHIIEFASRATEFPNPGRQLQYASPQVANGEMPMYLDDIYSLGATIYELLTSKPPFYAGDLMKQLQNKVAPPMTTRRKELRVIGDPISRVWEETVAACLSKDPGQRPPSMTEVIQKLELKSPATAAADMAAVAPPPPAKPKQNPMVMAAVVATVFMLLSVAGFMMGRKPQPKATQGGGGTTIVTNTVQVGPSAEDLKKFNEAQAKQKAAEDKLKKVEADIAAREKADKERQAQAQKDKLAAEKKTQDALAEAAKTREMLKAASENKNKSTAESERERADLAAKLKQQEDEAKKNADALAKLKMDQDKAAAETDRIRKEAIAAKAAADAEAARLKQLNDDTAKKQREAYEKQQAENKKKADEQAKQLAMINAKAKQEADQKLAEQQKLEAARKAAEEAARRFSSDKKVWVNTIGLRFVPVGNVFFATTETRYSDFEAYYRQTRIDAGQGWRSPGFKQAASHPVVNVNWSDAQAFCRWLTAYERTNNNSLPANYVYRLPTDLEWSKAVGLEGEAGQTPADRDSGVKGVFPWGNDWPPPANVGNYPDSVSYDRFTETAPVGSFKANRYGIYDLGGNVWEWCDDWFDGSQKGRVLRGGSYFGYLSGSLNSSFRRYLPPTERRSDNGFRVVIAPQ